MLMGLFSNYKKAITFFLFFTLVGCCGLFLTQSPGIVFAGSIGGGENEPTPPGGGPPGLPTVVPSATPTTILTNTPTPASTSTPTPTPNGPTNTPTPIPSNTPTPIPPTVTPNLSPCPDAANTCAGPTSVPTQVPTNQCNDSCDPTDPNACGTNQACICADAQCSVAKCLNPQCSEANQTPKGSLEPDCQCNQCDTCGGLACEDIASNPGRVIVVPVITPGLNPGLDNACFNCATYIVNGIIKDCNELLTPHPQEFKTANGKSCKDYTISVDPPGDGSCSCTKQVCCPSCEAPKVVPGYEIGCAACDFQTQIGGQDATCPCSGAEIEFQSDKSGCVDFGNGQRGCGQPGDPPKITYGDSGFYDVEFSCSTGGGQTYVCKKEITVGCDCDNMNPTPTSEPSPTPTLGPWFKLKNASFSRQTDLVNLIPDPALSFDNGADDLVCHDTALPSYRCMLSREAGVGDVEGTIDLNSAPVSHRGWKHDNANVIMEMTPEGYLNYVKSKKKYITILKTDLDNFIPDQTLTSDRTYILDDPAHQVITLGQNTFSGQTLPFVLIINGDVIVENNIPSLETVSSAIIVNGDLRILNAVSELYGIYYAKNLDFTFDNPSYPNPIKITGNIISRTATDTIYERINSPINKPGIFVDFDIDRYLDLWPLLTIKEAVEQEEIQ